jgi:hypothetical protein
LLGPLPNQPVEFIEIYTSPVTETLGAIYGRGPAGRAAGGDGWRVLQRLRGYHWRELVAIAPPAHRRRLVRRPAGPVLHPRRPTMPLVTVHMQPIRCCQCTSRHPGGMVTAGVVLLAGGAHQAADGIVAPPGGERAGADVGLAERRWVVIRVMQLSIHQAVGRLIASPSTSGIATAGRRAPAHPSAAAVRCRVPPGWGACLRAGGEPGVAAPAPGRAGGWFRCHAGLPEIIPAWPRGALGG